MLLSWEKTIDNGLTGKDIFEINDSKVKTNIFVM
jgi:hypothetical protein